MKKIIIAGAGHGGLTAAYNLAKNGFRITVFEAKDRKDLGYDWNDSMVRKVFEDCCIEFPDEEYIFDYEIMSFYNPKMNIKLSPRKEKITSVITINRRFLINYLIDKCIEVGVDFRFNTKLLGAICDEFGVIGVKTEDRKLFCDLLIDACGVNSPIRSSLNKKFGIITDISSDNVFYAYRAYYKRVADGKTDPNSNVTFYHCGHCGMDWLVTAENHIDVLIGGFGGLFYDDIKKSVNDYRERFPYFDDTIISGGRIYQIPISKMLPLIVCNGYAAVGDSASMIEPLSGSGISFSMRAGKLLADCVISSDDVGVKSLWKYNYDAFVKYGKKYLIDDVVRKLLVRLSADDVDYLFESGILSDKEMIDKANSKYSLSEIIQKLSALCKKPKITKELLVTLKQIAKISDIQKSIPEEYNRGMINDWIKKYNSL